MSYVPTDWRDAPDDSTPLERTRLQAMELKLARYAEEVAAGGLEGDHASINSISNMAASSTAVAVTGLEIVVPPGPRPWRLWLYCPTLSCTGIAVVLAWITQADFDGNPAGAQLDRVVNWGSQNVETANRERGKTIAGRVEPSDVARTYQARISRASGTGSAYINAGFGSKAEFWCEQV